jgi:adenylate cyclase
MPDAVISRTTHRVPFPPDRVWPILRRTDWLNRSLGLPPVDFKAQALPEGGSRVTASATLFGTELRWIENPFEWVEPEYYKVRRTFEGGPLEEALLEMQFVEAGPGTTEIRVNSEFRPRGTVGSLLVKSILLPKAERDMSQVIQHVIEYLRGGERDILPSLPRESCQEGPLTAGLQKLRTSRHPEKLVAKLETLLRDETDVALCRIRPLAIARDWACDPWEVLRLFLHATRSGLLNLSWEVLCPNCRSSRMPLTTSLAEVASKMHCEACQIRFDAEFDKSVELKFAVHHSIRPCDERTFCLAGPGAQPHVVSQMILAPAERREWKLPALRGVHRLRSPQVRKHAMLHYDPESPATSPTMDIVCQPDGFAGANPEANLHGVTLRIQNPNPFPVQVALEKTAWNPDILTAARVANWQEFRDLFATQVLSPNEQITVGSQIVLFTDLRGSTAMYCGIGDAPAYALVRDHFRILTDSIAIHHGAIVKTIGDAVMATFSQVTDALLAVEQMQAAMDKARLGHDPGSPLQLKAALHAGPCLAVNANDKLDYFGTTINLAARLVDVSKGGDVIVSEDLFNHPETAQFIQAGARPTEPSEVHFRGFDAPRKVWRIGLRSQQP